MKPLPKTLLRAIARQPERFDEGWSEQDGFGNHRDSWAHWVYLAPGWCNHDHGMHIIHECSVRECIDQYRRVKPCDCEECIKLQKRG